MINIVTLYISRSQLVCCVARPLLQFIGHVCNSNNNFLAERCNRIAKFGCYHNMSSVTRVLWIVRSTLPQSVSMVRLTSKFVQRIPVFVGRGLKLVVGSGFRNAVSRKRWKMLRFQLITNRKPYSLWAIDVCKSRWPWMTLNDLERSECIYNHRQSKVICWAQRLA